METASWAARLACLAFGIGMGLILSERACSRLCRALAPGEAVLMKFMLGTVKTVVACAATAVTAPLPATVSILYTGLGILAAHSFAGNPKQGPVLSVVYPWLILYLPFTGALACLGGGLLVLAADVPAVAGLAMAVLAAPMALLQFGPEGGLVLLTAAALVCPGLIFAARYMQRQEKI